MFYNEILSRTFCIFLLTTCKKMHEKIITFKCTKNSSKIITKNIIFDMHRIIFLSLSMLWQKRTILINELNRINFSINFQFLFVSNTTNLLNTWNHFCFFSMIMTFWNIDNFRWFIIRFWFWWQKIFSQFFVRKWMWNDCST